MLELKQNWNVSNSFSAVIYSGRKLRPWAISVYSRSKKFYPGSPGWYPSHCCRCERQEDPEQKQRLLLGARKGRESLEEVLMGK